MVNQCLAGCDVKKVIFVGRWKWYADLFGKEWLEFEWLYQEEGMRESVQFGQCKWNIKRETKQEYHREIWKHFMTGCYERFKVYKDFYFLT